MSSSQEEDSSSEETLDAVNGSRKTIAAQRKTTKKFAWLGDLVTHHMEQISPEDQDDAAWRVQCLMRRLTKQHSQQKHDSSTASPDYLEDSMEAVSDED